MIAQDQELLQVRCAYWGGWWPRDSSPRGSGESGSSCAGGSTAGPWHTSILVKEVRCQALAKGEAGVKIVCTT